jgi:hypothetical protein
LVAAHYESSVLVIVWWNCSGCVVGVEMNLSLDFNKKLITRGFRADSQCFRILQWLKSGKTLTPWEALDKFGTLALHSRIAELRDAGYDIKCTLIQTEGGKQVGRYSIE